MRYPTIVVYDDQGDPAHQYTNIGGAWVYQRGPYVLGGDRPYVTVPARIEALEQLSTGTDDDGRELALV